MTHAVMDALLGAACLGDIGRHFPDSDPRYLGINSQELLSIVCGMLREKGYEIVNLDVTVIAQKPKLSPHLPEMTKALENTMGIGPGRLNLKATTEEALGFTGREEGIAAHCVCLIEEAGLAD